MSDVLFFGKNKNGKQSVILEIILLVLFKIVFRCVCWLYLCVNMLFSVLSVIWIKSMMGNSKKRMGCVVNINSNLVRRESVSVVRVM